MRLAAAVGFVLAAAYLALTLQLIPFTSRRHPAG